MARSRRCGSLASGAAVLAAVGLAVCGADSAQAQSQLDAGFGVSGRASIDVGPGFTARGAYAIAVQADGKIVLVGAGSPVNTTVARLEADGSADSSFGTSGVAVLSFGEEFDFALAVAVAPDAKILVGGFAYLSGDERFALARLNPDGTLDASFGSGGLVLGGTETRGRIGGIAVQPDGKILAGGSIAYGFGVARYLDDGSLDATFGDQGVAATQLGAPVSGGSWPMVLQPDGKIVFGGAAYVAAGERWVPALVRYHADGAPDLGFGIGGGLLTPIGTAITRSWISDLTIDPLGRLVASLFYLKGRNGNDSYALGAARWDATGALDLSFGTGGVALTDTGAEFADTKSIALQPDGRIVVAGRLIADHGDAYGLVRYGADGTLDPTFGDCGVLTVPASSPTAGESLVLRPDGRILAAGGAVASGRVRYEVIGLRACSCADCDACQVGDACRGTFCGDGTVDPLEECDDGNATDRDGCSAACRHDFPLVAWIDNPRGEINEEFGYAVALSGSRLAVGAPYDTDELALGGGAVFLFDATTGAHFATPDVPTSGPSDRLGWSVAARSDRVLAGAPGYDVGNVDQAGAVFLIDAASGEVLHAIESPSPVARGVFGESVAFVGGDLVVGAPGQNAVFVFDAASGSLERVIADPEPPSASNHFFGRAVAALGDDVLVGAPGSPLSGTHAGAVFVFDHATGALLRSFPSSSPGPNAGFGFAVAALGDDLLVGEPYTQTAYLIDGSSGAVLQTFLNPTPGESEQFGAAVAALGGSAVVGAYFDLRLGARAGAAYLFDPDTGALVGTFLDQVPDGDEEDAFGVSIATSGDRVAIGSPHGGVETGAVSVFAVAPCGNGGVDAGEQCDDGNVSSGDGCTSDCQLESGTAEAGAGTDVVVRPLPDVELTFSQVTVAGEVSVSRASSGYALPPTLNLGGGAAGHLAITTTAAFTGSITVCLGYDDAHFAVEADIALLHYDGGAWVAEPTVSHDLEANVLCATVTSLSPFALAEPLPALIPGTGSSRTECMAELAVDNPTNAPPLDRRGFPSDLQTCRDNDPACDSDGGQVGACSFQIALCFNRHDPRLPACGPESIDRVAVRSPSARARGLRGANGRGLVAGLLAMGARAVAGDASSALFQPRLSEERCTSFLSVSVPLRGARLDRPGRERVRIQSSGRSAAGAGRDSDAVKLVCIPE